MENKALCRRSMLLHKKILLSLFATNANDAKFKILGAKPQELKLVIKVLHFIASGNIPIKTFVYDKLVTSRILKFMKVIENKSGLKSKLKQSHREQQEFLLHFAALYPLSFQPLFEEQ